MKGAITEAEFTRQVLDLAKLYGWRTAHFRPGRTSKGWRTAVSGDGVGFPDIILVKYESLIAAELKVGGGKCTKAQAAWLQAFNDVYGDVEAFVWTPEDWPEIERTLRG